MPPNFGLATQQWKLEDSDSEEIAPDPPRYKQEMAGRKSVIASSVGRGESVVAEHVHDNHAIIDPELSQRFSQSRSPRSYWSRWDIWKCCGLLVVLSAVIFGVPRVEESSSPGSTSRSASLPPRNILHTQTVALAKFDIGALNLACQGSQLPICDLIQPFHALDLNSSLNNHEIEALRFHLGALLRPTKLAISEEECFYFPQLQFDVHQARVWPRKLLDFLKAGLDITHHAHSLIAQSRSDAEERLKSVDEAANNGIWKIGTQHGLREKVYRENESWLNILEAYIQKLKSRDAAWDWELRRQTRLEKDSGRVEEQIHGLRIGTGQSDSANLSCTALNMQRVERQLINTMMRAAEDDAAAKRLGTYFDAL